MFQGLAVVLLALGTAAESPPLAFSPGTYEVKDLLLEIARVDGTDEYPDTTWISGTGALRFSCPDSGGVGHLSPPEVRRVVQLLCEESFFDPRWTWECVIATGGEVALLAERRGGFEETVEDTSTTQQFTISLQWGEQLRSVRLSGPDPFAKLISGLDALPSVQLWREAMAVRQHRGVSN